MIGEKHTSDEAVLESLFKVSSNQVGLLDSRFLAQSISVIASGSPITVRADDSLQSVLDLLRDHHIGCVLVVDPADHLVGIFGERDFLMKVAGERADLSHPVSSVMTSDPVTASPDMHIAYALNLMSDLGFRHVPVVDDEGRPLAVLSVRDVLDYLVASYTSAIMEVST